MKAAFPPKTNHYFETKKMVGVYLNKEEANHIALLSILAGSPRSSILKKIIREYLDKQNPIGSLINQISKFVLQDWKILEKSKKGLNGWQSKNEIESKFKMYQQELKKNLELKRIPSEIINEIILKMTKEKD